MKDTGDWIVNPVIEMLEIAHIVAVEVAAKEDSDQPEFSEDHLKLINLLHHLREDAMMYRFRFGVGNLSVEITFNIVNEPLD